MRDKDVSVMQMIIIINKKIIVFLWQKMKTRHKHILKLLHKSQRSLCPLSRLLIEMPFSSSDYSWFHNGHGGHYWNQKIKTSKFFFCH